MVIPFIVWNWNGKITLFFGFVYIRNGKMFGVKGLPFVEDMGDRTVIHFMGMMVCWRNGSET